MGLLDFEEKILFSTVRIVVEIPNGASSVGTGFIVSMPIGNSDSSAVFLVSNKHVFVGPDNAISLTFTRKDVNGLKPDIGNTITINQQGFNEGYSEHPNLEIDLACINISKLCEPNIAIYMRHYSQKNFSDLKTESLTVGSDVMFIGYPDNRFDTVHNVPILRKGCISSSPRLDFLGAPQFLIDAQVFGGSSGSPVFAEVRGEHRIVGVVTATMIKNQQLQTLTSSENLGVQTILGLGIVLRINLVTELLLSAIPILTSDNLVKS